MNGRSWWPSVLQLFDYWDRRLEHHWGLVYSSVLLDVCYVGSGLCNELNTCSGESYWVFVRLIACDLETSKRDGLGPSCAFKATKQEWRAWQRCSINKVLILGQWQYLLTHPVIFKEAHMIVAPALICILLLFQVMSPSVINIQNRGLRPVFQPRSQRCEKVLLASSCLFVRPSAWNNSSPSGRIFLKFDTWVFFEHLTRKFKFH